MSSKTSFFNTAIFKSDIKRFWWTGLVEALLIVFTCIIPLYEDCSYIVGRVSPDWNGAILIPMVFGCALPVLLFSYLHTSPPASTLHAYPITRTGLFLTKITSALVLTIVPIVINGIILFVMALMPTCAGHYAPPEGLEWMYQGICYTLMLMSLATAVNMMTGNSIAALIFTLGFTVLPGILYSIFETILHDEVYGFSVRGFYNNLDYIYMDVDGWNGLFYIAYSAILSGIAYVLYRIRKIESNGEIIAFRWLNPLFIGIISILASGLSYSYFRFLLDVDTIFMILPFGIIGAAIAHMISRKSLDFKGCLRPIALYVVCALCFICVIEFDLTGFERRIPVESEVESIEIYAPIDSYYGQDVELPTITDKESIQSILSLHQKLIEDRNSRHVGRTIHISYNLKNNRKLQREYSLNLVTYTQQLKPIYETNEFRKYAFALLNTKPAEFSNVEICDRRFKNNPVIYPNDPLMEEIISAVKKDMMNYSYEDFTQPETLCLIQIHWIEIEKGSEILKSEHFYVTESCTNTLGVLGDMVEIYFPTADDIESVYVTINSSRDTELTTTDEGVEKVQVIETPTPYEMTFYEPETIEEIYAEYSSMLRGNHFVDYNNAIHVHLTYKLKNDHHFTVSCSYDYDKLPGVFSRFIEE